MKFLIAGLGSIGQRHLQNLRSLSAGEIIAYRVRKQGPGELEKQYSITSYSDLDKALNQKPDAVLVTNPTSLHIPIALAAARKGCHLFIEKPLSHSLEGVNELLHIVREKKLVVLIGCNMRFHPALRLIRTFLEEGRIGRIVGARLEVGEYLPDWHPGEDYRQGYSARSELGGGVILTLIHELDYACWFFGQAKGLFCLAGKKSGLEIDVEDIAEILLHFEKDILAEVHLDYIQRAPSRSCQIIGEEGTILWDQRHKRVEVFTAAEGKWQYFPEAPAFGRNQMYLEEMKHFLACIKGKEKPVTSLEEGIKVLEIALAAKESSQTRSFVNLNP